MNQKHHFDWLQLFMLPMLVSGMLFPDASAANFLSFVSIGPSITIQPEQMVLSGLVITHANASVACTQKWMASMPAGGIILGAAPDACTTDSWTGGSATLQVNLPLVYAPTVYVMRISWPDREGKGLHSPLWNRITKITLDGKLLFAKSTLQKSTYGDYYALEHEMLLTTIVVRQTATHTITFEVPARTAWDMGKVEFFAYRYPQTIRGVGYSPYRDCQYPGGPAPSLAQMEEDLDILANTTNTVRTYSSTGVNQPIPALAKARGLNVYAGAWLDKLAEDESEIQGLLYLVNTEQVPVDGLIVGNEYYLRHRTAADLDTLYQAILRVKNGIMVSPKPPVMTAEIDNLMFQWENDASSKLLGVQPAYQKIIDAADYVMVHIYPYWSGRPIEGAANMAIQRAVAMRAYLQQHYPGQNKRLIIGESGWPSSGQTNRLAVPSLENQKRYFTEFMRLAEKTNMDSMYFDGIDEGWKLDAEGPVGSAWGYNYSDRTAKHFLASLLVPAELFTNPVSLPMVVRSAFYKTDLAGQANQARKIRENAVLTQNRRVENSEALLEDDGWVYSDWQYSKKAFSPLPSGNDIDVDLCDRTDPAEGKMSIRVQLRTTPATEWWSADLLYLPSSQGKLPPGFDASIYNQLTFQARGETGQERVEFYAGGFGAASTLYPDSLRPPASLGYVQLTQTWKTYTIDLRGLNLSHIVNGLGVSATRCANPDGAVFYLDDIRFRYDANMPPPAPRGAYFPVYQDAGQPGNHYYPSNWMGDGETPGRVTLSECWTSNPHTGSTAIQIDYRIQSPNGWAGIYWTHPAENWGDRPGGYNLSGVKRLTFWARSDSPGSIARFMLGGIGYGKNCLEKIQPYPDSVCPKVEIQVVLTADWTKYSINLTGLSPNRYFDRVVGGFGWIAETPMTLYLDDIQYEFE